jgi:hypothetical protein
LNETRGPGNSLGMLGRIGTWGIVLGVVGAASSSASSAWGGPERPLLVAVEVAPGGGAEAAQVRKAIGEELHRPILALGDSVDASFPSIGDPDVLLVDVGRERIVLSLRRPSDEPVARTLPAPSEKAARLRAIAWMAGNLARDQVTPFLAATTDARAFASEPTAAPAVQAAVQTQPPPVALPPTVSPSGPAETAVAVGSPSSSLVRPWSVLASGGLAWSTSYPLSTVTSWYPVALQLELVKRRPDGWMWGGGVDVMPRPGARAALFALGGAGSTWGPLRLEGSIGIGLENAGILSSETISRSASSPPSPPDFAQTYSNQWVMYGRVFATASWSMSTSWDLVARVGAQDAFATGSLGVDLTGAVGVRVNLP